MLTTTFRDNVASGAGLHLRLTWQSSQDKKNENKDCKQSTVGCCLPYKQTLAYCIHLYSVANGYPLVGLAANTDRLECSNYAQNNRAGPPDPCGKILDLLNLPGFERVVRWRGEELNGMWDGWHGYDWYWGYEGYFDLKWAKGAWALRPPLHWMRFHWVGQESWGLTP